MTSPADRYPLESEFSSAGADEPEGIPSQDGFVWEEVTCWRCDKCYVSTLPKCPACLAPNRTLTIDDQRDQPSDRSPAIIGVIWAFLAISATTLICTLGAVLLPDNNASHSTQVIVLMVILEVIHTVILMVTWLTIKTDDRSLIKPRNPALVWLTAIPLLAATLAVNYLYHVLLLGTLDQEQDLVVSFADHWIALTLIACLQPAIVEELFFRGLAMKASLEVLSPTQAIVITSLMFALAHLGQPLSLPILALIGLVLGYLRMMSGSLLLPMLFHFLHNLAVLSWKGSL